VLAVKIAAGRIGFPFVTADQVMGTADDKGDSPISSSENGLNDGRRPAERWAGGTKTETTLKWLQAVNAPRWQRMPAGSFREGFVNLTTSPICQTTMISARAGCRHVERHRPALLTGTAFFPHIHRVLCAHPMTPACLRAVTRRCTMAMSRHGVGHSPSRKDEA